MKLTKTLNVVLLLIVGLLSIHIVTLQHQVNKMGATIQTLRDDVDEHDGMLEGIGDDLTAVEDRLHMGVHASHMIIEGGK